MQLRYFRAKKERAKITIDNGDTSSVGAGNANGIEDNIRAMWGKILQEIPFDKADL